MSFSAKSYQGPTRGNDMSKFIAVGQGGEGGTIKKLWELNFLFQSF